MSEETANSFYGRRMRCIAEAKRHAFVGKSPIRTAYDEASGNKFVFIVLNDGHASLLGYTVDGTYTRAVRYEDSTNGVIAGVTHELEWLIPVWSYENQSF
nr:hypothetical protein [Tanacetum cinerariifolium]